MSDRKRIDQIEFDVAQGKYTPQQLFTVMRNYAAERVAEERKARDLYWLNILRAIKGTLAYENNRGAITDTLWYSEYETLFDFIDSEINQIEPSGT